MYMHHGAFFLCQLTSCYLFTQHVIYLRWRDTTSEPWTPAILNPDKTNNCHSLLFSIHCNKHHFPHCASNPLFSARPVRLITSLFRWGKTDCLSVWRFHIVADAGSTPCHKSASNNLQNCSLPPTGPIKPWFLTEGKLMLSYIIPSSWGLPTDV